MLKQFNNDKIIDTKLKVKIEKFFDYKWSNDKNQALDEEEEKMLLDQLPTDVQVRLFTEFLYSDFLKVFKETFQIPKDYEAYMSSRYHTHLILAT